MTKLSQSSGEMLSEGHVHSNTLGMDGSKIGVFKEGDEVRLSSLLQGHDSGRLEAKISLKKNTMSTKEVSNARGRISL